ncbi:MAG: TetR family transcriptional regulator [Myxococcales bacterium]|nr:TetR family transcriptional regulator [Myxococcales bacterium]
MPVRTERAEERKRSVLEATLRLLAREGPRAVTHRAVAAEAGTSLRATTYYFDSRAALLREALLHYATTSMERFARVIATPSDAPREPLDEAADRLAAVVMSDLEEDRVGLVAELELCLEIGRDPELEGTYATWERGLLEALEAYATVLGTRAPERDARLVLATLRGLEIEALVRPSRAPSRADLRATFRALLGSLRADG